MFRVNFFLAGVLALAGAAQGWGQQVAIGDIYLSTDPSGGAQQFYFDNLTGLTSGCTFNGGTPVCDDLEISGTLNYQYEANGTGPLLSGSATLSLPIGPDDVNGGNSYAPANFEFDDSFDFTSATFSGTLTPATFLYQTDGIGDTAEFNSDGTVVSTDIITGTGLLLATAAPISSTPEPATLPLLATGCFILFVFQRVRQAQARNQ